MDFQVCQPQKYRVPCHLNPLITDDAIWHHLTLAARMLSVGAIHFEDRFCASKKGGIGGGGGFQLGVPCTWQLPWLAVEKPWSALAGPLLTLLAQTGSGTTPLPLLGRRVWSTAHIRLVPTPTPTGVGDK